MGSLLLALSLASGIPAQNDLATRMADAARLEKAGDAAGALKLYTELLPLARPDDPARPQLLETVALLETRAGNYPAAAAHATEAAALYGRRGDARRRGVALNTVGLAWLYAGDYHTAARTFDAALEQSRAAGDVSAQAEQFTNLGNVYFFLGRYADAAKSYETALELCDANQAQAWAPRRRYVVEGNRAALYQRLGRDEQALAIYREIESSAAALPPREQAQFRVNLGALYRHLGDPVKALAAYDEARGLFSRDQHVEGELSALRNRGIALALDLGELDAATQAFSESLSKATAAGNRRQMLQARLYRGEAQWRAGHAGAAREDFAESLQLARALGTREEEWKALYGLGRLEMNDGRRAEAAAQFERAVEVIEGIREAVRVPTLRSDFFNDKREVYDALIAALIDGATPGRLFELIERSHSRAWRERLGLSGLVQLADVQRALAPGNVLLEFWNSPLGSAVLTVTRDRADVAQVRLDPAVVQRLADTIGAGPSSEWQARAAEIAAGMPLALPAGARHLMVVPDGAFSLVPFELLPAGGRPIVEQVAVNYLPTAAVLLRPALERRRLAPPWRVQLRAFGNPTFTSATMDDAAEVRAGIQASGEEVRAIAGEIGGAASIHVGPDDRKAYLYQSGQVPPLLHIATHAVADANAMEQSRILFSPPAPGAGADYLFLKEAYDLDLEGVELAVLSACETERGRLLRGEGVQSFSRAFLAAGARTTVTTLWRVPDAPTSTFMTVFYHHLQRGESRAEALRLAKLRFLQSGPPLSDPHYWAAFVLTGDGLQPIPRAVHWATVAGVAGIVLVLAAAAFLVARRIRHAHRRS